MRRVSSSSSWRASRSSRSRPSRSSRWCSMGRPWQSQPGTKGHAALPRHQARPLDDVLQDLVEHVAQVDATRSRTADRHGTRTGRIVRVGLRCTLPRRGPSLLPTLAWTGPFVLRRGSPASRKDVFGQVERLLVVPLVLGGLGHGGFSRAASVRDRGQEDGRDGRGSEAPYEYRPRRGGRGRKTVDEDSSDPSHASRPAASRRGRRLGNRALGNDVGVTGRHRRPGR